MSQQTSTGLTSVTGTVTSTAQVKRPTNFYAQSGSNQTITLGTVPASKKWTLLQNSLCCSTAGAANGSITLNMNGQPVDFCYISGTTGVEGNGTTCHEYDYNQAPQIAATQTVTLVISAGCNASGSVQIIEEDA